LRLIITGAASGIGRATALQFASRPVEGKAAEILLVDRDPENLAKVASEVAEKGARTEVFVGDLGNVDVPAKIIATAIEKFGGLDTLISNAGAIHRIPLVELGPDEFDRMMNINARATLLLAQASHIYLKAAKGSIVATASTAADNPAVPLGAYSASKVALVMLVRQMAAEWGADGIRCNCVSPGPTHTSMTKASYDDPAGREKRGQEIPLGRVGQPDDLAKAIYFLAGTDAGHISGINLLVDGGLSTTLGNSKSGAANNI